MFNGRRGDSLLLVALTGFTICRLTRQSFHQEG